MTFLMSLGHQAESLLEQGRIISVQTRTELNQQADNLEQEIMQLQLRSDPVLPHSGQTQSYSNSGQIQTLLQLRLDPVLL